MFFLWILPLGLLVGLPLLLLYVHFFRSGG
jgi:hypothetical protein